MSGYGKMILNKITQVQKDKCHSFSPLHMLALNVQLCMFHLKYSGQKSVRGYVGVLLRERRERA